ncbi:MAG: SHOCT-like domain-containing protein [Bellilinea sp.]
MANAEERLKILNMLQEGKISAAEAARLLEALEAATSSKLGTRPPAAPNAPYGPGPIGGGRWMRVRVTDTNSGKTRVNVRLPLNLVGSGIRLGMKFAPEIDGLDTNDLMEWINSGELGQIVDVFDDEDGEHVEVFIE